METIVKRQTSFRLREEKPNQQTIDAINEAKSGKELETLDLDNFSQYVAKL